MSNDTDNAKSKRKKQSVPTKVVKEEERRLLMRNELRRQKELRLLDELRRSEEVDHSKVDFDFAASLQSAAETAERCLEMLGDLLHFL